jgi:hypothetical protein
MPLMPDNLAGAHRPRNQHGITFICLGRGGWWRTLGCRSCRQAHGPRSNPTLAGIGSQRFRLETMLLHQGQYLGELLFTHRPATEIHD